MKRWWTRPAHIDPAPNARQIFDNFLVTTSGDVLAGFRVGAVRWDYTGLDVKRATLEAVQDIWALLAGHEIHERITTRPHPVQQWAARLDARTPNPLPDVCSETWNAHLARMQHVVAGTGMDDKVVFRYVKIGEIGSADLLVTAKALRGGRTIKNNLREIFATERRIADAVSGAGWRARRMTLREQEWLRARSLGLSIPAPMPVPDSVQVWDRDDLLGLDADVRWEETPLDRVVSLTAWRNGAQVNRAVQILTLTSEPAMLRYPENGLDPWLVFSERAVDASGYAFGTEWSINGRIATGEEIKHAAEMALKTALNLDKDYRDFDEPPREDIGRGIQRAKELRDEVTTGDPRDASRFIGSVNVAVWGQDVVKDGRVVKSAAEVCEERGEALRRLYGGNMMRFHVSVPKGQAARLSMFVPGENTVWDRRGYQRQFPLDYLAAGLPNVSVTVGDGHGSYVGPTRGAAKRPTFHDPWYATEGKSTGRDANIWVIGGTLGAGKSVLGGSILYNASRRGARVVARDPSGPLLRLCKMPELKPFAVGLNLLEAQDGVLNPPSLIRDPLREEYVDESRWRRAMALAQGERSDLVQDIARRTLQHDLYAHPESQGALRSAARLVQWTRERSMWDLVDGLHKVGSEHARQLGDALHDASERPRLSLIFAPRGEGGDFVHSGLARKALTIVATPGIKRAPDNVDRRDWNHEERAADPVIYLTGLFTGREVYDKPMDERAIFLADEAEDLTDGAVGRAFLSRLGRDHSKWNIAVYLLLKNFSDAVISTELRNFIAGAWVGKMASLGPAEAFLDVLGVEDRAYARSLLRLSANVPGEFVHLDADGRVGGMRVDVDYYPALAAALFNDPAPAGASAWRSTDEVLA